MDRQHEARLHAEQIEFSSPGLADDDCTSGPKSVELLRARGIFL